MVGLARRHSLGACLRASSALLSACILMAVAPAAAAQPGRPATPAATQSVLPSNLELMKLIWTSMIALDQANDTGNYSVLRDIAAPTFQTNNSDATLAGIFQPLRAQRVDLSDILLVTPTLDFAPAIIDGQLLRLRGRFPLRPTAIAFDLLFQPVEGEWRLFGIAVVPVIEPPRPTTAR